MRDMDELRNMNKRVKGEDEEEGGQEEAKQEKKTFFDIEEYELFVRVSYTFAYQALSPSPRPSKEQKEFLEKYPDP